MKKALIALAAILLLSACNSKYYPRGTHKSNPKHTCSTEAVIEIDEKA